MLPGLRSDISNPATKVDKGNLNEQPESEQANQCAEWDRRARSLSPDKQIQDQDKEEGQSGEKQGSLAMKSV